MEKDPTDQHPYNCAVIGFIGPFWNYKYLHFTFT